MKLPLDSSIEAILFFKGEPMTVKELCSILDQKKFAVEEALQTLSEQLADRGVRLIFKENTVMLVTAPEMGEIVEKLQKEELQKDLGKAGLETLSIILYRGPVTRADIDYIRGVNSSFILRRLLIRGLIEKIINPQDRRTFLYKPTIDLLAFMGVEKIENLPEYTDIQKELEEQTPASQEDAGQAQKDSDSEKENNLTP